MILHPANFHQWQNNPTDWSSRKTLVVKKPISNVFGLIHNLRCSFTDCTLCLLVLSSDENIFIYLFIAIYHTHKINSTRIEHMFIIKYNYCSFCIILKLLVSLVSDAYIDNAQAYNTLMYTAISIPDAGTVDM